MRPPILEFVFPMPPAKPHPSWFRPYRSLIPRQPAPVIPQPAPPVSLSASTIYSRRRQEAAHEKP